MARYKNIFLGAVLLLIGLAALMHFIAAGSGDKEWLLLAAQMTVDGRKPYVDFIEISPPLIIWLYAIFVWLSAHLSFLKDYHFLALAGFAACAFSARLCQKLFALHPAFEGQPEKSRNMALLLVFIFIFLTPTIYFFDREHILLVCTFPYMLRFMPALAQRKLPRKLSVVIALMAGLGFCIKPYTVIVFVMLQLLTMCRDHSCAILYSLENIILYALGGLYLACIWAFAPGWFTTVLPMAIPTYSAFNRKEMAIFYLAGAFITAGVAFADFRSRYETPYRKDVYYFIGVSVAYFVYAMFNNGWGYTYHPLICSLWFLSAWLWCEYGWLKRQHEVQGLQVKQFVFGQRGCAFNFVLNTGYLLWVIVSFFGTPLCDWSVDCSRNKLFVEYMKENNVRSFGAISEDFHKWSSLARLSGASFDTRYNALWMVPQFVVKGERFTLHHLGIIHEVGEALAEDLNGRKPEVVFVDDKRNFFGTQKDLYLPDFFSGVTEFKAAWAQYHFVKTINRCKAEGVPITTGCRYDIYSRNP